jgi:hypothetical protein
LNLRAYLYPGRGDRARPAEVMSRAVHPMIARRPTALPILLSLLAGCSANAPTSLAPPAVKAAGSASALAVAGDLRGSVRLLTSRAPENLLVSEGRLPGSRLVRVQEGYAEVVLAKTNADGTVSTRCVDSPEGADAFLNDTTPSHLVKAAQ